MTHDNCPYAVRGGITRPHGPEPRMRVSVSRGITLWHGCECDADVLSTQCVCRRRVIDYATATAERDHGETLMGALVAQGKIILYEKGYRM